MAGRERYAYRIETRQVKEPDFPYHGETLGCTTELVRFAFALRDYDTEHFVAIYLDAQNHVLGLWTVEGTVNQAVVYPREVLRHALLHGASAIILVHNHPSGHPRPSDADIRLTTTLKESAKQLDLLVHDSLIIGGGEDGRWFSMREEGIMP